MIRRQPPARPQRFAGVEPSVMFVLPMSIQSSIAYLLVTKGKNSFAYFRPIWYNSKVKHRKGALSQMHAYEFSTTISNAGQVLVPAQVADKLPEGASVCILILVDEVEPSVNGHRDQPKPLSFLPSLEELVAEIKRRPPNPANFHPGDGLLAWRLANPVTEPDPDFDETAWNQESTN